MTQIVTAKIQVFPSTEQRQVLVESMTAFQTACEFVSAHVYETKDLTASSLNRKLYRDIRSQFGLPSQMAQSSIRAVIAAYRSMKANGQWEQATFKRAFTELVWNRDYLLRGNVFSVNSLNGRLKIPYTSKGLSHYFDQQTYRFGQAKLLSRKGKFFLHISVERDIPDQNPDAICNVVGVDRGLNFLANTYDSKGESMFYSGRAIKNKKANYRRLRRELQMLNTRSARRRLKAISGRENRWMSDVNHQVSKALVDGNPAGTLFAIEDLKGIRENVLRRDKRTREQRAELVGWSYFDLEQKLRYKAKRKGSMVVKFDPHYTSQTCPKCGHTEKANRDKRNHLFTCKCCGYTSNDDRIGAMNLYRLGVSWLAQDANVAVSTE